jgi:hypothetical protein
LLLQDHKVVTSLMILLIRKLGGSSTQKQELLFKKTKLSYLMDNLISFHWTVLNSNMWDADAKSTQ